MIHFTEEFILSSLKIVAFSSVFKVVEVHFLAFGSSIPSGHVGMSIFNNEHI